MKKDRRKIIKRIAIIVAIAFAVSLYKLYPWGYIIITGHYAQRMKVHLLCQTDHQSLLEACREVLKRDELETGRRYKASRFPQVIRELAPRYVCMTRDSFLILRMQGGIDHFGVRAYPEDFKSPFKGFEYGDKELIPGLWYYDEDYLHNPEYDKKIEALLQKRK